MSDDQGAMESHPAVGRSRPRWPRHTRSHTERRAWLTEGVREVDPAPQDADLVLERQRLLDALTSSDEVSEERLDELNVQAHELADEEYDRETSRALDEAKLFEERWIAERTAQRIADGVGGHIARASGAPVRSVDVPVEDGHVPDTGVRA